MCARIFAAILLKIAKKKKNLSSSNEKWFNKLHGAF